MSVTSYLALYTTLLGWQQYNNLWQIAVGTGLIYLPFVSMVLKNTFEPFTAMNGKEAAQIALRRLGLQVLTTFFVIAIAAAPTVPLDPRVLHFTPQSNAQSEQEATPGHTHTTYDNALPVPTGVKIPIFWYLVMGFSNGLTHAASQGLSHTPLDLRALHAQLNLTRIQDPQLKQEVAQFYNDCYVPAYSAYMSHQLTENQQAQMQQSLKGQGQDDVGWIGSETFLTVGGLYDAHKATIPINGFAFDPSRDVEEGQVQNHSSLGNPNCKTWWSDSSNGLKAKLKNALPPTFWQQLGSLGGDAQKIQDAAVKTLITHNMGDHQTIGDKVRGYESLNDNVSGDYMSRFVGAPIGVLYESLSFYPKLHLLMNALPVIQASLLFALYAFLALGIPFSSYRISFCVTGAMVMFSLIFCSFLWQLVQWFDNTLIQSLYPSLGGIAGLGMINGHNDNINQLFVDMIVGLLYVVLPILWMTVMGWASFQAGTAIANLMGVLTAPATSAGERVSSIVRKKLP
jgi:hypothetical protein